MPRFDAKALYDALERRRAELGLTWQEVAQATGVPASTLIRTKKGGRLEVEGMLAMVSWLGAPVARFVVGGSGPRFVSVWEFEVRPESVAEFERVYGPDGDWTSLFRRADGYSGSLLLKDRVVPHCYLTVDRWRSEDAYARFREGFGEEYRALDERCKELTVREREIGGYDE
jgi:heme-degrading monooxygenase HmoA